MLFHVPDEKTGDMEPMTANGNQRMPGSSRPQPDAENAGYFHKPCFDNPPARGRSLVDLVEEVQRIKTALYRSLVDFIAFNNAPQTIVERDSGADLNALMQHRPSSIVQVDAGKAAAVAAHEAPAFGRRRVAVRGMGGTGQRGQGGSNPAESGPGPARRGQRHGPGHAFTHAAGRQAA